MSRIKLFAILAMGAGAVLIGRSLFADFISIPLVGVIRYSEMNLGGSELAITIVIVLGLATILIGLNDLANRIAWFLSGIGIGLTIASLVAIYRGMMDKVEELGGQDVKALLAKTEFQPGVYLVSAGLLFFLGGMIATLVQPKKRKIW